MSEPTNKLKPSRPDSHRRILYLFTRTPLHVGAGASVGAIDQPVQRERHTGFPIVPGTTLKGVFADSWSHELASNGKGKLARPDPDTNPNAEINWLFGAESDTSAAAGALQFSEAKLLAFPVRSAKGSFAWITCPLILRRFARDGGMSESLVPNLKSNPESNEALVTSQSQVTFGDRIVLEEYTFTAAGQNGSLSPELAKTFAKFLPSDAVWKESEIAARLVVVSDGMMSFFAQSACEIAQHVRISDVTGTADHGGLFNQENVPSETVFYSVLHCFVERSKSKVKDQLAQAGKAAEVFGKVLKDQAVFQFGGDASTGLGFCSVALSAALQ